jgi:hypothetical protein
MGHISGTWELFYVNIEEKVWLLVKKIRTWKDWQGDWNFAFWQKLGDFIETKVKKSPTSPGLVSPVPVKEIRNLNPQDIRSCELWRITGPN